MAASCRYLIQDKGDFLFPGTDVFCRGKQKSTESRKGDGFFISKARP